jgi:hypothetical protein
MRSSSDRKANLNDPAFEFPLSATGQYQTSIVLGLQRPGTRFGFHWDQDEHTKDYPYRSRSHRTHTLAGDILQTLMVYAEIPAGGPKAVPKATGTFLEVERFTIEGKTYFLKSLRGQGRVINLGSGRTFVLKVTGDSMNQAGIQDGEYVLLRRQDGAVDGDIVAVELRGEDDLATLKRYRERNGKIVLQPESDNPAYQEREFSRRRCRRAPQPFYIQGVALGVFQPAS